VPDPTLWGLFVVASVALLLTPGPAVLYIVARSVKQGRAAGSSRCSASISGRRCISRRRRSGSPPSSFRRHSRSRS